MCRLSLDSILVCQTFPLYLSRGGFGQDLRIGLRLPPIGIFFYVVAGRTHLVPWMMGQTGEAVDGRGMAGRSMVSVNPRSRSNC